jgi:hypothetical protein
MGGWAENGGTFHKQKNGGAVRMRSKNGYDYENFKKGLFVSIYPIKCNINPKLSTPNDISNMRQVAYLEYECFAQYLERFRQWPEYNDKKKVTKDLVKNKVS